MNTLHSHKEALESVVPGIVSAYETLRATKGRGFYTSSGAFFNHTLFGRDLAMSAEFVHDFDHDVAREVIVTLAKLQGDSYHKRTQEEPGRIHHEYRDFSEWTGRFSERIAMRLAGLFWGARHGRIQTYFAADTTANYIRLVNKFCRTIDASLLDQVVQRQDGSSFAVAESIILAADWIVQQVDDSGRFMSHRSRWSLPYQTFQDSVTAYCWSDSLPANTHLPHSFLEAQAFSGDALEVASVLLAGKTEKVAVYKETSHLMRKTLLTDYWSVQDGYFTSMLAERDHVIKPLDVPNISAGWTLNTSWWDEVPVHDRSAKISSIVNRLFSDEFLTDVGLRTRSKYEKEPLGTMVDYHGSQTVWPMFNFMVIQGLRRHRMYRLAEQLERRVVNGINSVGTFAEFMIVNKQGQLYRPRNDRSLEHVSSQMIPEKNIAFTIVPLLTIARRTSLPPPEKPRKPWHIELEDDIMSRLTLMPLYSPEEAAKHLQPKLVYLTRAGATLKSVTHLMKRRG